MKKLVIFFFLTASPGLFFAQALKRVFQSDLQDFTISRDLESSEDRLFVTLGHNSLSFDHYAEEQWIYALDFELNVLDSASIATFLNVLPGDLYQITRLKVWQGHLYATFNTINPNNPAFFGDQFRSAIVKLDSSLNLIQKFEFFNDSAAHAFFDFEIDTNGTVYLFGGRFPPYEYWDPTIYKLDADFNLVKTQVFDSLPQARRGSPFFLVMSTIAGSTLVCNSFPVSNSQLLSNLALDTNLNIIGYGSINVDSTRGPFGFFHNQNHHYYSINADSIYAYGVFFCPLLNDFGTGYFTVGFSKLDSSFNTAYVDTTVLLPGITPFHVPDPSVYSDPGDARTPDSLFIAINSYAIDGVEFFAQDTNTFYLYNYNLRRGKLNWRKAVTTGLTNGWHAVAALPGNRYALAFSQYDWESKPFPNLEVHVWILNENGDILNTREFKPRLSWSLYPNPAVSELHFTPAEAPTEKQEYQILSAQGAVVQDGFLAPGQTAINIHSLRPGVYFLQTSAGLARFVKKAR